MSGEMIERVARAIASSRHLSEELWPDWAPEARAAIKAMREPTKKMQMAFYEIDAPGAPAGCVDGWQAMIDAALEDSLTEVLPRAQKTL